jgi:uncharacterized protein DUF4013
MGPSERDLLGMSRPGAGARLSEVDTLRYGQVPEKRKEADLNRIADSFSWPFRGRWRRAWLVGLVAVLLLPLLFVPLLGYAVQATRAAADRPGDGPPPWRLYPGGQWVTLALLLLTAPFAVVGYFLSMALHSPGLWQSNGSLLDVESATAAALILALPWGVAVLVLMPHATVRYAVSLRARDLFDFASSLRSVRRDFPAWNVTVAAIVTAWAIGLACTALFCVGVVPGVFYAILVSAHATAALSPEGTDQPAR